MTYEVSSASPIGVIRSGSFSGSARSLVAALEREIAVEEVDVLPWARSPRLAPARLAAHLEAFRYGRVPWSKTAAWTSAVQSRLEAMGYLRPTRPTLIVQSMLAATPAVGVRYAVYTDRVGIEGASSGGGFRSRFSPRWLERERRFLLGAVQVFVMGPSTRQWLISEYEIPPDRVTVVGAGPNCEIGPVRQSRTCHKLLFVGTQWDLKGGPEIMAAFSTVRHQYQNISITIVGSTPHGPTAPGVTIEGRVDHRRMPGLYAMSDALVMAPHIEAFGIAILEALLHGIPCIGSTVGNQQWLIGDAGICVEPGNVGQLKQAIKTLMENYPEYKKRAEERRNDLEGMSWQHVAQRVLEALGGRR